MTELQGYTRADAKALVLVVTKEARTDGITPKKLWETVRRRRIDLDPGEPNERTAVIRLAKVASHKGKYYHPDFTPPGAAPKAPRNRRTSKTR